MSNFLRNKLMEINTIISLKKVQIHLGFGFDVSRLIGEIQEYKSLETVLIPEN